MEAALTPEQAQAQGYSGWCQHLTDRPCPRKVEDRRLYCATCMGPLGRLTLKRPT